MCRGNLYYWWETHIPSDVCGETRIPRNVCVQEAWYPGKHASLWDWFLSMDTTPLADVLWWVNTYAYYIRARVMANNNYSYVASYVKLSHKYSKATVWRACSWHMKIIFAYVLHQTIDVAVHSVRIIICTCLVYTYVNFDLGCLKPWQYLAK